MLQGWKAMHPDQQYVQKYLELYEHMNDPDLPTRPRPSRLRYENPIDLPGRWYLQAITQLFKENLSPRAAWGLGKTLKLAHITCPTYLLAGESDDITTKEQVFAARELLGTPKGPDRQHAVSRRAYRALHGLAHAGADLAGNRQMALWLSRASSSPLRGGRQGDPRSGDPRSARRGGGGERPPVDTVIATTPEPRRQAPRVVNRRPSGMMVLRQPLARS